MIDWNSALLWAHCIASCCSTICTSIHCTTHSCIYFLRLHVQSQQRKSRPKEAPRTKANPPLRSPQKCVLSQAARPLFSHVCSKWPRSRRSALLSLRPVSSVSPVVAVGAAASQLQRGGGGAVPNHPRWGALHGRQPGSLQDLLCGGELREPERVPLRRSHRLQWFRYQVSGLTRQHHFIWMGNH